MIGNRLASVLVASFLCTFDEGAWAFSRSVEHAFDEGQYYPGGELRGIEMKVGRALYQADRHSRVGFTTPRTSFKSVWLHCISLLPQRAGSIRATAACA